MKALYLGKGRHAPSRKLMPEANAHVPDTNVEWTTLDMCADTKPDIVFDLQWIEEWRPGEPECCRIPVLDSTFDEIHAYDVLEHYGKIGDYKGFFRGWREFWRILKPGGYFIGACPAWNSAWVWSDPGHTRAITEMMLGYLTREMYERFEDNPHSPLSSYESYVDPCWWRLEYSTILDTGGYWFVLKKVVS